MSATSPSILDVSSGSAGAPSLVENLIPRYRGGLWLAVKLTPPAAPRRRISKESVGVGTGRVETSAAKPSRAKIRAASAANRSARNRVS